MQVDLDSGKGFFNTATGTSQTVPFFIDPFRQGETRQLAVVSLFSRFCGGQRAVMVLFSFCIFGTAMFAEPSVTEIEEVVGLMHLKGAFGVQVAAST